MITNFSHLICSRNTTQSPLNATTTNNTLTDDVPDPITYDVPFSAISVTFTFSAPQFPSLPNLIEMLGKARLETRHLASKSHRDTPVANNEYFTFDPEGYLSIRGNSPLTPAWQLAFTYPVLRDTVEAYFQVYAAQGGERGAWTSRAVVRRRSSLVPGQQYKVAWGDLEVVRTEEQQQQQQQQPTE